MMKNENIDDKVNVFLNWLDEEINERKKEYDRLCRYGAGTSITISEIDLLHNIKKVVKSIWEVE